MKIAYKLCAFVSAIAFVGVGYVATARAVGPAMVIQAGTVTGYNCIVSSQFHRGQAIVWRIRVIDTKTGKGLGPKGLKSVIIELSNGKRFVAHFGQHPPDKALQSYWTYSWTIPKTFPTGSFRYTIVATNKAGTKATFAPFKVWPSQLTVIANK